MPNTRNQFLRNEFLGGWSFPNYNYSGAGALAFYARRFFAVEAVTTPPGVSSSFLLVYRSNSGGGGYNFGEGASNIVVDGGAFELDAGTAADGGCVLADPRTTALISVNNVSCTTVL